MKLLIKGFVYFNLNGMKEKVKKNMAIRYFY